MQIIAVQRELEDLKTALDDRGYKTVYMDAVNQPVTACIYHEVQNQSFYNSISAYLENGLQMSITPESHGVLLINANNKNMDEIIRMIEHRCYSPLF